MPQPWNAALLYNNLADAAMLAASSALPLTPVDRLKGPHIARKWRTTANAGEFVLATLTAPTLLDTIAMFGVSLSSSGQTVRVRVSATDPSGQAGELYDSTVLATAVDPNYASFVVLLPAPVLGQYVRIDLTDPSAAYIEAGRLVIGKRSQFSFNFSMGWTSGYVDRSTFVESRGGQTHVNRNSKYRISSVTFEAVTEVERYSFVEDVDRLCGTQQDLLFISRCDSPNLARDSIWGLISEMDPTGQPQLMWSDGRPIYAKSYRIKERL